MVSRPASRWAACWGTARTGGWSVCKVRTSEGKSESCRLNSTAGLDLEKFVRLNSVLGVNLKPNEDADYAEHPFLPMSPMEALRTGRWQDLDKVTEH